MLMRMEERFSIEGGSWWWGEGVVRPTSLSNAVRRGTLWILFNRKQKIKSRQCQACQEDTYLTVSVSAGRVSPAHQAQCFQKAIFSYIFTLPFSWIWTVQQHIDVASDADLNYNISIHCQ